MEASEQEIDEEKEPTKELKELKDLEEKANSLDKEENKKEDTKEILEVSDTIIEKETNKTTEDNKKEDIKELKEETKEAKEEPKEPKNTKVKRKPKKIVFIICGVLIFLIIVILVLLIALPKNDTKKEEKETVSSTSKTKYSAYATAIKKSLNDDSLATEIKKMLSSESINATTVELMSLDIDSDGNQELVVYAEENKNKCFLHFEVDDTIYYEDSYKLESKTSIGYVYSIKDDENYWYTKSPEHYTIHGKTKLVIKEEDFINDYFAITSEYESKPFLSNAIEYKFDKKLDVEKLEQTKITAEDILKDNKTTQEKIKEAAQNFVKERIEAEEKRLKEEAEKLKKEEEEKKAKENSYKLNGNLIQFGKYMPEKEGEITKLTINKDGTGTINGKACTWNEVKKKLIDEEEIPVIEFDCGENKYDISSFNNNTLTDGRDIELKFEE